MYILVMQRFRVVCHHGISQESPLENTVGSITNMTCADIILNGFVLHCGFPWFKMMITFLKLQTCLIINIHNKMVIN